MLRICMISHIGEGVNITKEDSTTLGRLDMNIGGHEVRMSTLSWDSTV
jgi:hypothetical protein